MIRCTYCGVSPAETRDHIPPLHYAQRLDLSTRTVVACRECNCALGGRVLLTHAERREFVRGWLRRRYGALLRMPHWTAVELAELGPELRQAVQADSAAAERLRERLTYDAEPAYLESTEHLSSAVRRRGR